MATSYSPKIITDGLVLCLDAGDRKSYSGSGTTWTDRSGNGYNGTLSNNPFFVSSDNCFDFDGADDLCRTTLPVSELDRDCTVIITCTVEGVGGDASTANRLFSMDRTLNSTKWCIGTRTGTNTIQFAGGGGGDTNANFTYSLNEIFQVALVLDGTGHKLYKNANLESSGSPAGDSSNFGFASVGCRSNATDRIWNGKIFNVMAYNRQLTDAEILQNYNATKGRFGL